MRFAVCWGAEAKFPGRQTELVRIQGERLGVAHLLVRPIKRIATNWQAECPSVNSGLACFYITELNPFQWSWGLHSYTTVIGRVL